MRAASFDGLLLSGPRRKRLAMRLQLIQGAFGTCLQALGRVSQKINHSEWRQSVRLRTEGAVFLNDETCSVSYEVFKTEHLPGCEAVHYAVMKTSELTKKQVESVTCPTCGAAPKESCELN